MNNEKDFKRYCIVFLILVALFGYCCCRLFYNQVLMGEERKTMAERQYQYIKDIDEQKYLLLDRNGKNLLDYTIKYYAIIDQFIYGIFNKDENNKELSLLKYTLRECNFDYTIPEISNIRVNKEYVYEVDKDTYEKLKQIKNVKGFYTYAYTTVNRSETWKIENIISTLKRTEDNLVKDANSLEMDIYSRTKNNQSAKVVFQRGVDESIISETYFIPKENVNVKLTIDRTIEDNINELLNKEQYINREQIGVVLMESNSGKILAMTQKNNRLPNVNLGAGTIGFAPGSIFKTIVEETAIEMEKISLADTYNCCYYKDSFCKKKFHGIINGEQAYVQSCNNAFESIGRKAGYDNFINMAKAQGLYEKVLNLHYEVKGNYVERNLKTGEGRGLAIGQDMNITPVQALSIANTVVNDGVYVKPYIIDSYVDDENNVIEQFSKTEKTVIKKTTANIMKNQMIKVVNLGTAQAAIINGIEVGGKTGTSERDEKSAVTGDLERHNDGWFVGFFKVNNKYYTMVVFVKDLSLIKKEEAANTAVPIFREVVQQIKKYL